MSVAVHLPQPKAARRWAEMLAERLPDRAVTALDDVDDPAAIAYAVVWQPRAGDLARLPNLRAILSIGAGIDHVLADPDLPTHLPIIRTVGRDLTQRMREYVALHVLRHHRDMPRQLRAQAAREWTAVVVPPAPGRTVGVMGLGNLGGAAAATLTGLGFDVRGWSASPKSMDGVETHAGPTGLPAFLSGCEIVVNLLPLTDATRGVLSAPLFNQLPEGACLINAARGGHLVDDDLLAALDSGRIGQATLDVFNEEPLPPSHPYWDHPGVTVTAHLAARIDAATGVGLIAENIASFDRTGDCRDIADPARGY